MEEKKGMPGWVKGCLTGCAVLLLLAVILMTFVCAQIKDMFQGMVDAEQSYEQLVEQLGDFDEYSPDGPVVVTASQMERFLAVREGMAEDRARLDAVVRDFDLDTALEEDSDWRKVFGVVSAVSGLMNPAGEYIAVRNEKLLEANMSLGEYSWIYAMGYYSWLGHDLTAGPELTIQGETRQLFNDSDSPLSPGEQHRRYRRVMDVLFRNHIAAVSDADPGRVELLTRELGRFENRPRSVIWEDGLPEADAAVLEPYRDRLEATWHKTSNLMELPFQENRGGVQIRVN